MYNSEPSWDSNSCLDCYINIIDFPSPSLQCPYPNTVHKNTIRNLQDAGVSAKFGPSSPITHAKLWIIDQEITVLGSHNMSRRAVTVNDEASVKIVSKEVAGEFTRYFEALWNRL